MILTKLIEVSEGKNEIFFEADSIVRILRKDYDNEFLKYSFNTKSKKLTLFHKCFIDTDNSIFVMYFCKRGEIIERRNQKLSKI